MFAYLAIKMIQILKMPWQKRKCHTTYVQWCRSQSQKRLKQQRYFRDYKTSSSWTVDKAEANQSAEPAPRQQLCVTLLWYTTVSKYQYQQQTSWILQKHWLVVSVLVVYSKNKAQMFKAMDFLCEILTHHSWCIDYYIE